MSCDSELHVNRPADDWARLDVISRDFGSGDWVVIINLIIYLNDHGFGVTEAFFLVPYNQMPLNRNAATGLIRSIEAQEQRRPVLVVLFQVHMCRFLIQRPLC